MFFKLKCDNYANFEVSVYINSTELNQVNHARSYHAPFSQYSICDALFISVIFSYFLSICFVIGFYYFYFYFISQYNRIIEHSKKKIQEATFLKDKL